MCQKSIFFNPGFCPEPEKYFCLAIYKDSCWIDITYGENCGQVLDNKLYRIYRWYKLFGPIVAGDEDFEKIENRFQILDL